MAGGVAEPDRAPVVVSGSYGRFGFPGRRYRGRPAPECREEELAGTNLTTTAPLPYPGRRGKLPWHRYIAL